MKVNLLDTTFIIPIRIDSIIRLENLLMSLELILQHFQTQILIIESSPYPNQIIPSLIQDPSVNYIYYQDKDPVFYKTKLLNYLTSQVKTTIIGVWDADVLILPLQIKEAILQLSLNTCDIAYPYDGECLDTSDILREYYWRHRNLSFLQKHRNKMNPLYAIEGEIGAVGGAFFAKTEKYVEAGMENENFYGWGLEDGERHYRWLEFGYRIYRSKGCMFHLSHPRDINGAFRSKEHNQKAIHDMNIVVDYSYNELIGKFHTKYVK